MKAQATRKSSKLKNRKNNSNYLSEQKSLNDFDRILLKALNYFLKAFIAKKFLNCQKAYFV